MYYAKTLYKNLEIHFGPEIIGEKLSYKDISKKLNETFSVDNIKIKVHKDKSCNKKESYSISGFYDPDNEKYPINVTLHFPSDKKEFYFTQENYNEFIFALSQTIQHELIHHSQYCFQEFDSDKMVKVSNIENLSKTKKKKIDYLREWSEIEAYAHDIAMELNYFYPNKDINYLLKNIDDLDKLSTYKFYHETFEGTDWKSVKKKLFKKIVRWMPYAYVPVLTNHKKDVIL